MAKQVAFQIAVNKTDEVVKIGDREFSARTFTANEEIEVGKHERLDDQVAAAAPMLQARALDKKPVKVKWLGDQITKNQFVELLTFYIYGPESGDPNAE